MSLLIAISSARIPITINCKFSESFFGPNTCEGSTSASIHYPDAWIRNVYNQSSGAPFPINVGQQIEIFKVENSSTILYFPQGLITFFPKLIKISLKGVKLKEVRQVDLAPFARLQSLQLPCNHLMYLERDLFAYNPDLRGINLNYNAIKSIHPTIFNHLRLLHLGMLGSQCIVGNFTDISEDYLKERCQEAESSTIYELLLIITIALSISIAVLVLFWIFVSRKLRSINAKLDNAGKFFSGRFKIEKLKSEANSYKEDSDHIYEDIVYFQSIHGEEVIQVSGKEYLRISHQMKKNKMRTKNTFKGENFQQSTAF